MTTGFNLDAARPTARFEDAKPGSEIELVGGKFFTPTRATVIQLLPEYGPTAIPYILVRQEGAEPELVSSAGQVKLTIIRGTADLMRDAAPSSAVRATVIPYPVDAVEFIGGAQSATEIIQWAAGKASVSYQVAGNEGDSDTLIIRSMGEETTINVGDWVVDESDSGTGFVGLTPDRFAKKYDVDPVQQGLGSSLK